jgi:hypothetical protein
VVWSMLHPAALHGHMRVQHVSAEGRGRAVAVGMRRLARTALTALVPRGFGRRRRRPYYIVFVFTGARQRLHRPVHLSRASHGVRDGRDRERALRCAATLLCTVRLVVMSLPSFAPPQILLVVHAHPRPEQTHVSAARAILLPQRH